MGQAAIMFPAAKSLEARVAALEKRLAAFEALLDAPPAKPKPKPKK